MSIIIMISTVIFQRDPLNICELGPIKLDIHDMFYALPAETASTNQFEVQGRLETGVDGMLEFRVPRTGRM